MYAPRAIPSGAFVGAGLRVAMSLMRVVVIHHSIASSTTPLIIIPCLHYFDFTTPQRAMASPAYGFPISPSGWSQLFFTMGQ